MTGDASIDGLGMTFDDLKPESQLKAIFVQIRQNQLTDSLISDLSSKVSASKAESDAVQADFDNVGRNRATTRKSSK